MEMFQNRLSKISNEQQRAYWQGYLDPLGGIYLWFRENLVLQAGFKHSVSNDLVTVLKSLALHIPSDGVSYCRN